MDRAPLELGPPRTLPEMRDLVGGILSRFELADGGAPAEAWIMASREELLTLRRLHVLLVGVTPHQARVKALIEGKRLT